MTVDELRSYKQIRTPDYATLADLVLEAKGPNRTMAQFAEVTGISASTLSRLVNHNIKKPLSLDVIIKIFENRADKENITILDALARANGFFPEDYAQRVEMQDSTDAQRNRLLNREYQMKNSLVAGVAATGHKISVVNSHRLHTVSSSKISSRCFCDFSIIISDETDYSETKIWSFKLFTQLIEDRNNFHRATNARFYLDRVFNLCSGIFLLDAWMPESIQDNKISFAFLDKELMDNFYEMTKVANIHTEMSLILVDKDNYRILSEVWIPGSYTRLSESSVFQASTLAEEDVCNDNDNFYWDEFE